MHTSFSNHLLQSRPVRGVGDTAISVSIAAFQSRPLSLLIMAPCFIVLTALPTLQNLFSFVVCAAHYPFPVWYSWAVEWVIAPPQAPRIMPAHGHNNVIRSHISAAYLVLPPAMYVRPARIALGQPLVPTAMLCK